MQLKPLFDRVLLERPKTTKVGSILIPDEAAKRHAGARCKIVAVGAEANPCLSPGMDVVIGQYAGTWVNAEGKAVANLEDAEFYLVQDADILCEVRDD